MSLLDIYILVVAVNMIRYAERSYNSRLLVRMLNEAVAATSIR